MLKGIEDNEPHSYEGVSWIGTVVAIDTTDGGGQCERIKAVVPGLYEASGSDISALPWIQKATEADIANGSTFGSCNIPPLGSQVWVRLQQDDPHHPEYYGMPQSVATLLAVFKTNYPNRRGWVDPRGNSLILDNTIGVNSVAFIHASGASITIDNAGLVTITSPTQIHLVAPVINNN